MRGIFTVYKGVAVSRPQPCQFCVVPVLQLFTAATKAAHLLVAQGVAHGVRVVLQGVLRLDLAHAAQHEIS